MLKTHGLQYRYTDSGPVMDFPDLSVERGRELLLLGASGTGKTTLLHLVAGMRTPTAGHVELAGDPFSSLPTATRDQVRGRQLGIVSRPPILSGASPWQRTSPWRAASPV